MLHQPMLPLHDGATISAMATECSECGKYLTPTEEHYYGHRCESCERKWFERVEAWRLGGDDDELDEAFQ